MKNALVNLVNISKSFDNQMVLDDLNLYIRENEFLTLLTGFPEQSAKGPVR